MLRMSILRRLLIAVGLLGALGWWDGAHAQVVALVNGEPITALDLAHRTRLIQLSTRKIPSRQEALDELIDDKLKLNIAKRYTVDIPNREIDSAYASIARRSGLSPQQFDQALAGAGITGAAFKAKLRSDIAWSAIVRGKFQSAAQVGDKEVAMAMQGQSKESGEDVAYEYRLQPILFIVPRGSSAQTFDARRKDAEAFRAKFQSCEEGIPAARLMRDVAIRGHVLRNSTDLPQQQRQVLDSTPVGRLTPPETTSQGVELFAVCAKEPSKGDETPAKRQVREKIMSERMEQASKRYLKELRSSAMIEIR